MADDANIIFGSAVDDSLSGRVRVSVVATGIDTVQAVEAQRPRLVAVGGGAAVAQPMPVMQPVSLQVAPAMPTPSMQPQLATPMPQQAPVSLMGAPVLPQSALSTEPDAASYAPPVEAQAPPRARPAAAMPAAAAILAAVHPAAGPGLFTEAPPVAVANPAPPVPTPAAPRNSLFGIVTGAIRGRAAQPAPVEPHRAEPSFHGQAEAGASVRPAATEEMGLDIPAFLRRQSS